MLDDITTLDKDFNLFFKAHVISMDTFMDTLTLALTYKNRIIHKIDQTWFTTTFEQADFEDMSKIIQINKGSQTSTAQTTRILYGYTPLPEERHPKLYCVR